MKPSVLLLALAVAVAGSAEEKKVNPRAFRLPPKKAGAEAKKTEPEKTAEQAKPVAAEGAEAAVSSAVPPAVVEPQPSIELPSPLAPVAVQRVEPEKSATSPTAFPMPNADRPEPPAASAKEPAKPATRKGRKTEPKASAPSFTLPGARPAPAKKKNPVTFRMPAKKSE